MAAAGGHRRADGEGRSQTHCRRGSARPSDALPHRRIEPCGGARDLARCRNPRLSRSAGAARVVPGLRPAARVRRVAARLPAGRLEPRGAGDLARHLHRIVRDGGRQRGRLAARGAGRGVVLPARARQFHRHPCARRVTRGTAAIARHRAERRRPLDLCRAAVQQQFGGVHLRLRAGLRLRHPLADAAGAQHGGAGRDAVAVQRAGAGGRAGSMAFGAWHHRDLRHPAVGRGGAAYRAQHGLPGGASGACRRLRGRAARGGGDGGRGDHDDHRRAA